MTETLNYDVAHLLAGGMVLVSFMLLYQDRMSALLNVFALHAAVLAMSVAWQAFVQDAPHLYVTAIIALGLKAILIPSALRRIVRRLDIHREVESAVGMRIALSTSAIDAVTYRCGAPCTYACHATDSDSTAACSANTLSSADIRS